MIKIELFRMFGSVFLKTDEVNKGLDEVDAKAKKLATGLDNLQQRTGKLGGSMTKWVTGPLVAAGTALLGLAIKTGNFADELLDLSAQTAMSTDALQEWRAITTVAGVSNDAMADGVKRLFMSMGEIMEGTGKAAEAFAALGISVVGADGELKHMDDIMVETMDALSAIEDPILRNAMAYDIFGKRANELIPILDMGADAMADVRDNANIIDEEALRKANDFRIVIDQLKEKFGILVMEIGTKVAPLLQNVILPLIQDKIVPAIEKFADKIGKVVEWFGNLSPGVQSFIGKAIVFIALLGPMLTIFSNLIAVIKIIIGLKQAWVIVQGLLNIALLANPIGLIILLIVAFIAIVVTLVRNWETVAEFFKGLWEKTKADFSQAINFIKNLFLNFTPVGLIIKHWSSITAWFSNLWKQITTIFTNAINTIKTTAINIFNSIKDFMINIWDSIRTGITNKLTEIYNTIVQKLEAAWNYIKSIPAQAIQWGRDIIQGLIDGIKGMIDSVITTVKDVAMAIPNGIKSLLNMSSPSRVMADVGVGIMQGLANGIAGGIPGIATNVGAVASNIKEGLANGISDIPSMAADIMAKAEEAVVATENFGGELVESFLNIPMLMYAANLATKMKDAIPNISGDIKAVSAESSAAAVNWAQKFSTALEFAEASIQAAGGGMMGAFRVLIVEIRNVVTELQYILAFMYDGVSRMKSLADRAPQFEFRSQWKTSYNNRDTTKKTHTTGGDPETVQEMHNTLKNFKMFAKGGVVTGPTLGLIGEDGQNEAVIPLGGGHMRPFAEEIANLLGGASGKSITQHITINSPKPLNPSDIQAKFLYTSRKLASEIM